ncbi:MAG: hypothetical protein L6R35_001858 [Caloplaca aegaea]|nr:MAG: hypothetical protein L6R35_001858 [Caloplaca aegaea]
MRSSTLPFLVALNTLVVFNSIAAAQGADTCRDILNLPKDVDGYPKPEPTCWTRLGMDGWMRTFVSTCNQAEPWGNCLMRQLKKGNEGAESIDCTRIHEDSVFFPEKSPCPPPMPDKIPQDSPELFYAVRSIWYLNNYLLNLYDQYHDLKQDTSFSGLMAFLTEVWPTETDMVAQDAVIARLFNENKGSDDNSALTVINLTLLRAFSQFDTGGFLEIATGGGLLHNDM